MRFRWFAAAISALMLAAGSALLLPSPAMVVRASPDAQPKLVRPPVAPVSSWGRKFNPEGLVPESGFRAFYFDRTAQVTKAFEEHADTVAVKYAWDELHGINSEAFAAYWVGMVEAQDAGPQQFDVSLSWSRARIFVNGTLVREAGGNASFEAMLKPGANLIEVEYINNWHTTEFKLTIGGARKLIARKDVRAALETLRRKPGAVHYVGLYESDNRDTSVAVKLLPGARDAVLWLDSYEAIDWRIDPSDDIAAVVVSSYSPGSRVVNAGSIPVFDVKDGFRLYSATPTGCDCAGSMFHCESDTSIIGVAEGLRQSVGLPLAGYAVQYAATRVVTAPYGEQARSQVQTAVEATRRKAAECKARLNPDFDSMFGKDG